MILPRSSVVKALWATLLFGSVPACIRAMDMDSYSLGAWRLGLSSVGMTLVMLARGWSISRIGRVVRRDWRALTAMGVCFGLHWLTYFQSIKLASASIGTLGFSTCGVQLPLLGWLFGFGRPRAAAMIGVALAMAGSVFCLPNDEAGDGMAIGMAIGVLSGTLYAALPLLHQRHAHLDHDVRTWAQFAFALPVFLITAPAAQWSLSLVDFLLVLHLGVLVTLVGHYLWVQVSTELPLSATSVLGYLQLPASLALNYLLIGEEMTPAIVVGGSCVVAGNFLGLFDSLRSNVVQQADTPAERAALVDDLPGDAVLPLAVELKASEEMRRD